MKPTVASLILSLVSVISVIAGFLVLPQNLCQRELIGCALMFIAIILAQLPGENLFENIVVYAFFICFVAIDIDN